MSLRLRLLVSLSVAALACGDTTTNPTPDGTSALPDAGSDGSMGGGRTLTIFYTNDEHSHLLGFGPELDDFPQPTTAGTGTIKGGIARRKALLDRERQAAMTAGSDIITVSAGDNAMGTLAQVGFTKGVDYALMDGLQYNVTCLGNHEFDFGPAALAQSIASAMAAGGAPQIVSTNIHFSSTDAGDDTLAALYGEGTDNKPIKRYHVVTTTSGIKIGFLGIMGSDAAYKAPYKTPVLFSGSATEEPDYATVRTKIYSDIQPTVDALRSVEKVDLVVALSHGGLDLDTPGNGDDYDIAQNVSGIDVIISGHSHTVVPQPITVANTKTGASVTIVQAGCFGQYLGRLVLQLHDDGTFNFDATKSVLIPVDDTTVPDATLGQAIGVIVGGIESTKLADGHSFLEDALSRATGMTVTDDASLVGDLYFYPLGKTAFDVVGQRKFVETDLLDLSADAEFAFAKANLPSGSPPPDVAIQAAGVIRADLQQGKTGTLDFGDAFRAFPLGASPYDGTIGYPLIHAYILLVELRGAMEVGASLGLTNNDFFLGTSNLRVTVDTSLPPFDAKTLSGGRVTKMEISSARDGSEAFDQVIFDASQSDPYLGNSYAKMHVVTNLYIASFATSQGITLRDESLNPITLDQAILHRSDGSEVKDYEAFAGYLMQLSQANGGTLPSLYDETSTQGKLPRRNLCTGPLCGK